MFRIMDDITGPNLGVTAIGHVNADDYEVTLIPEVNQRLQAYGKIGLLCHLGPDFKGFTVGAAWDDTKFGLTHLADFTKFALVSDARWVRNSFRIFAPLLSYPVRLFYEDELPQAIAWVNEETSQSAVA